MALMRPTPNIHGSGVDNLVNPRILAIDALQQAQEKLRATCPHGRDYPFASQGDFDRDRAIYRERLVILQDMIDDLTAEGVEIQKGFEK